MTKIEKDYSDIIDLPHHVSKKHPPMDVRDRAAQFAPFAALTGHKEAILETARLTDRKIILDENSKYVLDEEMKGLMEKLAQVKIKDKATDARSFKDNERLPYVSITYFLSDQLKDGGKYITEICQVSKIDQYNHVIVSTEGKEIPIDDILNLEIKE